MKDVLLATISTSNTTSSATSSKYPTTLVWPLERACSNALTNHSRVAVSVSPPNAEANVLPPVKCRGLHYRIEKTFAVSGNVPPSILGLPYIRLVYLSRIPPKGFTHTDICGMNREVTGARILLSLSPDTGTGSATQTVPLLDPSHNPCLNKLHHA